MALDPRLLESFVVLAEELHFGRAAERLNIAQPGLSQQIQRLEQQVGSKLLTRNSRMVELTASGRVMLEPARAALRATAQAERAVREASRITAHPLRVGVNFYVEDVVPALSAYASDHAEVQLWTSRMYEPQGQEMLAEHSIDAFVGGEFALPEATTLSRVHVADVPLLALAGPNHPISKRSAVPLSVYRQTPVVMFARDHSPVQFDFLVDLLSEGIGREALTIREFRPTGTGSNPDIVAEVGSGNAVGFGSPATIASRAPHLRFLPFDPPLFIPAYLSWQSERSAVVDAFVAQMSQ